MFFFFPSSFTTTSTLWCFFLLLLLFVCLFSIFAHFMYDFCFCNFNSSWNQSLYIHVNCDTMHSFFLKVFKNQRWDIPYSCSCQHWLSWFKSLIVATAKKLPILDWDQHTSMYCLQPQNSNIIDYDIMIIQKVINVW